MSGEVIEVQSWEECEKKLLEIKSQSTSFSKPWFRGQSSADWQLKSTLERRAPELTRIERYYRTIGRIRSEIESYTSARWDFPAMSCGGCRASLQALAKVSASASTPRRSR